MRQKIKRGLAFLLAIIMVATMAPHIDSNLNETQAATQPVQEVSSLTEWKSALDSMTNTTDTYQIKLTGDLDLTQTADLTDTYRQISCQLMLDLNGQTIFAAGSLLIVSTGGNLTITSSAVGGTMKSTTNSVMLSNNGGIVTINSGNFESNSTVLENKNSGEIHINGGTFVGTDSAIEVGAGKAIITNGNFSSSVGTTLLCNGGSAVVEGGTFTTSATGYDAAMNMTSSSVGSLTITGGTFTAAQGNAVANGYTSTSPGVLGAACKTLITNGTFSTNATGTKTDANNAAVYNANGTIEISGGTFQSTNTSALIMSEDVTITGGEFKSENGYSMVTDKVYGDFRDYEALDTWNGTESAYKVSSNCETTIENSYTCLMGDTEIVSGHYVHFYTDRTRFEEYDMSTQVSSSTAEIEAAQKAAYAGAITVGDNGTVYGDALPTVTVDQSRVSDGNIYTFEGWYDTAASNLSWVTSVSQLPELAQLADGPNSREVRAKYKAQVSDETQLGILLTGAKWVHTVLLGADMSASTEHEVGEYEKVLDLNGNTINFNVASDSSAALISLTNSQPFTITDSSTGGSIISSGTCVRRGTTSIPTDLTIAGGLLRSTGVWPAVMAETAPGTISLTGGIIENTNENSSGAIGVLNASSLNMGDIIASGYAVSDQTTHTATLNTMPSVFTASHLKLMRQDQLNYNLVVTASDFPDTQYGDTAASQKITLSNTGTGDMDITDISLDTAGSSHYEETMLIGVLQSGESTDTLYTIEPNALLDVGDYPATISATFRTRGGYGASGASTFTVTKQINYKVTAKQLTIAAPTVDTEKIYDGTTTVDQVVAGELLGVEAGDDVYLTNVTSSYDNANAGTGKRITINYELGGADSANYLAPEPTILNTGVIKRAQGTASVSITGWEEGTASADPIPASETNDASKVTYSYKLQGSSDDTYTATVPTAPGDYVVCAVFAQTTNYEAATATAEFRIIQAKTSYRVSDIDFGKRTYGSDTASAQTFAINNDKTGVAHITGVTLDDAGTEYFTLSKQTDAATGQENYRILPKNKLKAGAYQAVARISYQLGYADDHNTYSTTAKISYTIEKKELTVGEVTVTTEKTYDAKAAAAVIGGNLSGIIAGDEVVLAITAAYNNADAGENKTITVNYVCTGTDADNYSLPANLVTSYTGSIKRAAGQATITMANWAEGETPATPVLASTTNGISRVTYAYKKKGQLDVAYSEQRPTTKGDYVVQATFAQTVNYEAVTATSEFSITRIETPATSYTLTGTTGNNGWYTSGVTVLPAEGYQLSRTRDGVYTDSLTVAQSADAFDIYLKSVTGAITSAVRVDAIRIDTSNPTFDGEGEGIVVSDSIWRSFLAQITFERFFTDTQAVHIAGADAQSGIVSYEYQISATQRTLEELTDSTNWIAGSNFNIAPGAMQENIIYAKVTNGAGLVSYISSDGIVYDTQNPLIENVVEGTIYYGESYEVAVSDDYLSEILLDGASVAVQGTTTTVSVPASDSQHTLTVTDRTGNHTTVNFTVYEPWVRDGISAAGPRNLITGVAYKLGGGQWTVAGDTTVYQGGTTFYATNNGEVEFQKQ